jgi:RHS repeat-associated protein
LGKTTEYFYDVLNRNIQVKDALNGLSCQWFDADGNRTFLADPNGNLTAFTYDLASRLTYKTTVGGYTKEFLYNGLGQIRKTINGRGQETEYQYDNAGRLVSFTDPVGTVSYTYDENGNILTTTDSSGTITRGYDELNRVVGYTDSAGNHIQYTYDETGNLITLTYPGGRQVHNQYDAANRLVGVTDWAMRTTTYEYDTNGRLVKTIRPNGTVLTQSYDAAGQLLQMKDVDDTENIFSQYNYTYNEVGNITREQSTIEMQPFLLSNKTMTYTTDNRIATYNGEYIDYDNDGNMVTGPLAGLMSSFTFDSRNRLSAAGNTTYTYNAENHRVAITENGSQTSYVVNPLASLSQVFIKTDPQGEQTFYVYGLGLIGQEDDNGGYLSYHFDLRGSTIALTDTSGQVTDRFQYSPFGTLVHHDGQTSVPFLYNGRDGVMTDNNGLYYMRARYYNPEIKRFVNQDILLGTIDNGQSLNRYAYVQGNPVIYIDPSGLWYVGFGVQLGGTVGALFGEIQVTIAIDDDWNFGAFFSKTGGGGAGLSGSVMVTGFGSPDGKLKDIPGTSVTVGGSGNLPVIILGGPAAGVDIQITESGIMYYGSIGVSIGIPGAPEMHGGITQTTTLFSTDKMVRAK